MAGPITVQPFGSGTSDGVVKINIYGSGGALINPFQNPMTTLGDSIYGGVLGSPLRIAIGSTNQVWSVVGGIPAWQTITPVLIGAQPQLNGSGFIKATGTTISYDNSVYQVQLNGIGFIKASGTSISYDNSTYLTSYTETDPIVKAINGIIKSNGSVISAAAAGTDYQAPIILTTTGTSGVATFVANVLNIPNYTSGGGTITPTHIQSSGSNPGIALGTGAGTGATSFIAGSDIAGYITIDTAGSPAASSVVATMTLSASYSPGASVFWFPKNAAACGIAIFSTGPATTTFNLTIGTVALTTATHYEWYYLVIR